MIELLISSSVLLGLVLGFRLGVKYCLHELSRLIPFVSDVDFSDLWNVDTKPVSERKTEAPPRI